MSIQDNMLCQAKALTTKMAADTITVENLQRLLPFLINMKPEPADGCDLLSKVYTDGIVFNEGVPCGIRDPQTNIFRRRHAFLRGFNVSKIECQSLIACSPYSMAQFSRNLVEEVQNGLINTVKSNLMKQLMSDELVQEESDTAAKYVTALQDAVFLSSTATAVEKITTLTAADIISLLHNITSSFAEHNSGIRSMTLVVPAGLGAVIASAFGTMACCNWYNSLGFYYTNGFVLRGMFPVEIHVMYLEDKYFVHPDSTHTRILAFVNDVISVGYGTRKLYKEYSPKPFPTAMNTVPNIANALVDMRIIPNPETYIGVGLLVDAIAKFVFMRMKSKSIMMLDVLDTIFKI